MKVICFSEILVLTDTGEAIPNTKVLWHINPLLGNDREAKETRAITRQQLRKYATVLEPLLGSGPRAAMEVQLEAVFSAPRLRH
jgi:hypothetical protein